MYLGSTDDFPQLVTCRSYHLASYLCEEEFSKDLWYRISVSIEVIHSSALPRGI